VKQPVTMMNIFESRLQEFIIEGIEDDIDVNDIFDDIEGENVTAINIGGNIIDDQFTVTSEVPFFPLPQLALDLNVLIQEQTVDGSNDAAIIPVLAKQIGNVYAPLSMFEFYWPFTDEEFFMIKLCWICDKTNVPHYIVDDIVDLLRECQHKKITIKPEFL